MIFGRTCDCLHMTLQGAEEAGVGQGAAHADLAVFAGESQQVAVFIRVFYEGNCVCVQV